jgi:uncharacterized protein YecE (DUF72 family)
LSTSSRLSSSPAKEVIWIGTAGWAIPRATSGNFPMEGSGLSRYASVFNAAEINSTHHRSHQTKTYERWRETVPEQFRFSVKTPKALTHDARLLDCSDGVEEFLKEISPLAPKLGPILLQLPPSFAFDAAIVEPFCRILANGEQFRIACEPRHASWFNANVDRWLSNRRIARVAADPARHPGGDAPGGWRGLSYYRLHGSPRVYYSSYSAEELDALRDRLKRDDADERWCIFDNTASGAAAANAIALLQLLE